MCDGVRSGEKVFACVHACTCTCLCVFERPPPAAVTLADSLGVEGLWLRAAVMDRAELEARPNGLHSRQKISHHTSLFEHNTMALLLFFAQKMSNARGKSAKYSLSSGCFNYLLTREGFFKKRKKERCLFGYWRRGKIEVCSPIGGRTSHLSSHCWLSVIFLNLSPSGMSQISLGGSSQQFLVD